VELASALESLAGLETAVLESRRALDEAEDRYKAQLSAIAALSAEVNDRSLVIDSLVKRLPPEEADMHRQRGELATFRARVESLKADLSAKREAFQGFVKDVSRELVKWSEAIKDAFGEYAQGFLLETCSLLWSPQKALLGQGGVAFDFPAFELDMTGTNFPSPVRRNGPDQVSESQREFIDLAFRMALIKTAGAESAGTLVIDAPESSLDAVFAPRAASVLSRFAASSEKNRLVVTSNLVEGPAR
jgi:hypothetical protein